MDQFLRGKLLRKPIGFFTSKPKGGVSAPGWHRGRPRCESDTWKFQCWTGLEANRIPLIPILPTLATHILIYLILIHMKIFDDDFWIRYHFISNHPNISLRSKTYPNIHIFDSFDDICGYDALPSYFWNGIDSKIFRAGDNMGERGIRITSDN